VFAPARFLKFALKVIGKRCSGSQDVVHGKVRCDGELVGFLER
jgi:hypothetical protein